MKLNRKKVSISQFAKNDIEEAADLKKSEALSFVWELTEEVYSFTREYNVKSRLQRNVVSITRK
ncbi:MAG: hypothetical protein KAR07_03905 [Spirochaetes bacterium]|nr:hypothetical protein [Spirochaetota bacterium]